MSKSNLLVANSYLENDPTLPFWSIYNVVTLSLLSQRLFDESENLCLKFVRADCLPKDLFRLSGEIKSKLTESLRLAFAAFDEHMDESQERSNRRGDIAFMKFTYTPMREAYLIMRITMTFHKYFNSSIALQNFLSLGKISQVCEYIETQLNLYQNGNISSEMVSFAEKIDVIDRIGEFKKICKMV